MDLSLWGIVGLFVPAIMFGAIFLFSFGKEPRQFRNAIWLTLFVLFFLGALIIVSEQEWLIIVVLLAILMAPFIVIVFLLVNTVSVVKHEGFSLSTALPGLFALVMIAFIALYVFTPSYWPQWVADVGGLVLLEGLWFFSPSPLYWYIHGSIVCCRASVGMNTLSFTAQGSTGISRLHCLKVVLTRRWNYGNDKGNMACSSYPEVRVGTK
jgi:hypothetical protein